MCQSSEGPQSQGRARVAVIPVGCGQLCVSVPAGGARARPPTMQGGPLLAAQMVALLRKRLSHTCQAWKGALSDLLLPMLFVALAMGLFMVRPLAIDYPPLKLTPGHYDSAETYFFR